MNNYDYPEGADISSAPWNEKELPERDIEVTISVTLSKTVKVKVSDYIITNSGKDEDNEYFEDIDYSSCNLERAVEEQIVLPQDAYKYITSSGNRSVKEMLKDWNVDDLEVIKE